MSDGNEPDELRGCKAISLSCLGGVLVWLAIIGGILWLAG